MALETYNKIDSFVRTNPVSATDTVASLGGHVRGMKGAILDTFPNITGAVTSTHVELNTLVGVTGVTGTGNLVLSASPTFTGTVTAPTFSGSGASLTALNGSQVTTGTVADNRLSSNVALLNGTTAFSANQSISVAVNGAGSLTLTNTSTGTGAYGAFQVVNNAGRQSYLIRTGSNFSGGEMTQIASNGNFPMNFYTNSAIRLSIAGNGVSTFSQNVSITTSAGNPELALVSTGTGSSRVILQNTNGAWINYLGPTTAPWSLYDGTADRFRVEVGGNFNFFGGSVTTAKTSALEVGFQGTPVAQISSSGNTSSSMNGCLLECTGSNITVTIVHSQHVQGSVLTFIGNGTGGTPTTIAISGANLYMAGTNYTVVGSRTLAYGGMATAVRVGGYWVISGSGLS